MLLYAVIIGVTGLFFMRLPTGFLPQEDQGYIIVNVQLPAGASQERTKAVMSQIEDYMLKQPEVDHMVGVLGFSFSGRGQNAGLAFVTLKNWDERKGEGQSATALASRAFRQLATIRDAFIYPLNPPAIAELGRGNGVAIRLQDRGSKGHEALLAARNQLMGMVLSNPNSGVATMRPDGLEDAPQLQVDIDRNKASALGVPFASISSTLSTMLGSSYVNDFPNSGRLQRVMVQADAQARMLPEDLLKLNVLNTSGQPVPFSSFASVRWAMGAMQTVRYNGYPTMRVDADPKPGVSTGQLMAELEQAVKQLPPGFSLEWTGISFEEKRSGDQVYTLYAFSILAIFLCLAALYESWSIPLSVMLVVPLGLLGVILATTWGGLETTLLQAGDDHHHRSVGQERHPDHRVRQGLAGARQERPGLRAASRPLALPPHPDDILRLHFRRGAAVSGLGRQLGQPARHRHLGAVGHADWHAAVGVLRAHVLRAGAQVLQGRQKGGRA